MSMNASLNQSPRLLDQVRGKIRVKHYSIRTEQAYVDWIKRYVLHFDKRHPSEMGAREVEVFLTHLTVQEFLGHKDVATTMIYTHVLNKGGRGVVSPLDR